MLLLLTLACDGLKGSPLDSTLPDLPEDSAAPADTAPGHTAAETGCPDPQIWYADADGDGYGAPTSAVTACEAPPGAVADGSDCDDADAATHPGAEPDCTGAGDRDCDGRLDAADGDGDGAPSCVDCDDADGAVSPDRAETCATTVDDDCDGDANEPDALGCAAWYTDGDGDGWGRLPARCLCSAEADFRADVGDDCDDVEPTVYPGAPELCRDGVDQDCDALDDCPVGSLGRVYVGAEAGGELGCAMSTAGDVDGDGIEDLVVGARLSGGVGRAAVYAGPVRDGMVLGVEILGLEADAAFGEQLVVVDLDLDGQDDLVVAAPYADHPDRSTGAVYVFDGPLTATATTDSARTFAFGTTGAYLGLSLAAGDDWDGDGGPDLLLGSYARGFGVLAGLAADTVGEVAAAEARFAIVGDEASDLLGPGLDHVGDLDGDGLADVLFGAPYAGPSAGFVGLVAGPVAGEVTASAADGVWTGSAPLGAFGDSVWGLPDMDGDGRRDAAVASHSALYVLTGLGAGAHTDADAAVVLSSMGVYYNEGIVTASDLDGDGALDVVAGNPTWPDSGGAVLAYTWPGAGTLAPTDARAIWTGDAGDGVGFEVWPAGDADADGRSDLVVQSWSGGHSPPDVGVGWLLLGGLLP